MPRRPGADRARPPDRRRPGETGAGRESATLRREAGCWTIDGSGGSTAVDTVITVNQHFDELSCFE
jgi:hypothetical protein